MSAIPTIAEPIDLWDVGVQAFEQYIADLAAAGIEVDPRLRLERVDGLVFFYSRDDVVIHLAVPPRGDDAKERTYRFMWASLLSMTEEDLDEFLPLFVRRVVAHELGHALRDGHGRFGDNLWEEEQIANELAVALQNRRLSPEERGAFARAVDGAMAALADRVGSLDDVRASYQSQLELVYQSDLVGDSTRLAIEALGQAYDLEASEILGSQLSTGASLTVPGRSDVVDRFNEGGMGNLLHYLFFQLGWLQIDLATRATKYPQEFGAHRLGLASQVLPTPPVPRAPTRAQVRALHYAHLACRERNGTAARWFYRRYRACLVALVRAIVRNRALAPEFGSQAFLDDPAHLLEAWEDVGRDRLDLLRNLAPPELRTLFPRHIGDTLPDVDDCGPDLPHPTDIALWRAVMHGERTRETDETLRRLALLDRTTQFRALPAQAMLDVAKHLFEVRLAPGETAMWQGDLSNDVWIVGSGEVEWVHEREDGPPIRGRRVPGEVIGEFAFLTGEARSATVSAVGRASCFVLRAVDLRIQAGAHPSIMERIAGGLARRLAQATGG